MSTFPTQALWIRCLCGSLHMAFDEFARFLQSGIYDCVTLFMFAVFKRRLYPYTMSTSHSFSIENKNADIKSVRCINAIIVSILLLIYLK